AARWIGPAAAVGRTGIVSRGRPPVAGGPWLAEQGGRPRVASLGPRRSPVRRLPRADPTPPGGHAADVRPVPDRDPVAAGELPAQASGAAASGHVRRLLPCCGRPR